MIAGCELCTQPGGETLFENPLLRVVLVDDAHYPGFCRVILRAHVVEMTDLPVADCSALMETVWQVERIVRDVMRPDKINLAALGNVVPHVHWHVIPRYRDDLHFPAPVWAAEQRAANEASLAARRALLPQLRARLAQL